ncbi:MAG: hypothetical protein ABW106_00880 [Steroidobacteraceae bacterium]
MKTVAGAPVFELEFDKTGKLCAPAQSIQLSAHLQQARITDLILFAHGWNNDIADARRLYTKLFAELSAFLDANVERRFAFAVVLWPSKKFTDEELIPGGAAAVATRDKALIRARLKDLGSDVVRLGKSKPVAARKKRIARAASLLRTLEHSAPAQEDFVRIVRSLLSDKAAHADDGTDDLFRLSERELLSRLSTPVAMPATPGAGGATEFSTLPTDAGGGADFGASALAGIRRLMNLTTYYQMKERAGAIGVGSVAPLLENLRRQFPSLRLQLVGHSFGGRVMTAAADASDTGIDSLTLLQAAYSHHGLASKFDGKRDGFFRRMVTGNKVRGPIAITFTKNDRAVGIAYPLASRLGGREAAAFGDENDPYGGMGRNGAVKTPEASAGTLRAVDDAYSFSPGRIYNLNADAVITGHSDICKPEVAWLMASSFAIT